MITVTGAVIVFSTLPGASAGRSRAFASFVRTKTNRAGVLMSGSWRARSVTELRSLPLRDRSVDDDEQRMRLGRGRARDAPVRRRVTRAQLRLQVLPLVAQLAVRDFDRAGDAHARQLGLIESIPAPPPLGRDLAQVDGDRARLAAKSIQLRMPRVAARAAGQHGLREQSFAPERDEALRVEGFRMQRPEAHQLLSNPFCDLTAR